MSLQGRPYVSRDRSPLYRGISPEDGEVHEKERRRQRERRLRRNSTESPVLSDHLKKLREERRKELGNQEPKRSSRGVRRGTSPPKAPKMNPIPPVKPLPSSEREQLVSKAEAFQAHLKVRHPPIPLPLPSVSPHQLAVVHLHLGGSSR